VVIVGAVVVPSMVKQVGQVSREAPHYAHDLRRNRAFRSYDNRYHITASIQRDVADLPAQLHKATGPLR
jgi:hypothetical protein